MTEKIDQIYTWRDFVPVLFWEINVPSPWIAIGYWFLYWEHDEFWATARFKLIINEG